METYQKRCTDREEDKLDTYLLFFQIRICRQTERQKKSKEEQKQQ